MKEMRFEDLGQLETGHIYSCGKTLYGVCVDCRKLVKLNKWLIGDLHQCTSPEKEPKAENGKEREE